MRCQNKLFSIAFSLRSLLIFVFIWIVPLFGAKIVTINKKRRLVLINAGNNVGIRVNRRMCFYQGDKRVACGRVVKTRHTSSFVSMSIKHIRRVRVGMTNFRNSVKPFHFRLGYDPYILTPISYNYIYYKFFEKKETDKDDVSLWMKDSVSSDIAAQVIAGEVGIALSSQLLFLLGINLIPSQTIIADSLNTTIKKMAISTANIQNFGMWLDVFFKKVQLGRGVSVFLGGGIDYFSSKIQLDTELLDENKKVIEKKLYTFSSDLSVVSLRLLTDFTLVLDALPILPFHITPVLIFPLITSPKQTISQRDPDIKLARQEANSDETDDTFALQDISTVLKHEKRSFAIGINISISISF